MKWCHPIRLCGSRWPWRKRRCALVATAVLAFVPAPARGEDRAPPQPPSPTWTADVVRNSWAKSARELTMPDSASPDYPHGGEQIARWRALGMRWLWTQYVLPEAEAVSLACGAFLDPDTELCALAREVIRSRCHDAPRTTLQWWQAAPAGRGRSRLLELYLDSGISGSEAVAALAREIELSRATNESSRVCVEILSAVGGLAGRAAAAGEREALTRIRDALLPCPQRPGWLDPFVRISGRASVAELTELAGGYDTLVVDVALARLAEATLVDGEACRSLAVLMTQDAPEPRMAEDQTSTRSRGWAVLRALLQVEDRAAVEVADRVDESGRSAILYRLLRSRELSQARGVLDEILDSSPPYPHDEFVVAMSAVLRWGCGEPALMARLAEASLVSRRRGAVLRAVLARTGQVPPEARAAFVEHLPMTATSEFVGRVALRADRDAWTAALEFVRTSGHLRGEAADDVDRYLRWARR